MSSDQFNANNQVWLMQSLHKLSPVVYLEKGSGMPAKHTAIQPTHACMKRAR